ncbi:hypothetical protein EVA_04816 [gut metagenome]|uniref:Uncharacterized protein n=1 Tax=gut metagenome TaxID=749906 RepID=J9D389_9ZZZZ
MISHSTTERTECTEANGEFIYPESFVPSVYSVVDVFLWTTE